MVPVVVIDLVVVEPVEIIAQHSSIAGRQSLVVRRFFDRINDVVQKAVVETPLIEVSLHFGEFLLGLVKTRIFLFARALSTPDMVKIRPNLSEHLAPPLVAPVACFPIVVPVVLREGYRCYGCKNQNWASKQLLWGHRSLLLFAI
jgi:hypothetical protein